MNHGSVWLGLMIWSGRPLGVAFCPSPIDMTALSLGQIPRSHTPAQNLRVWVHYNRWSHSLKGHSAYSSHYLYRQDHGQTSVMTWSHAYRCQMGLIAYWSLLTDWSRWLTSYQAERDNDGCGTGRFDVQTCLKAAWHPKNHYLRSRKRAHITDHKRSWQTPW